MLYYQYLLYFINVIVNIDLDIQSIINLVLWLSYF